MGKEGTSLVSNYHNRGDSGCIFQQDGDYYKHYALNFTNVRNHEYPFDTSLKKYERLPCYCHENIKTKNIHTLSENFYSYESITITNKVTNEMEKVKTAMS